jgi:hypothetical protein
MSHRQKETVEIESLNKNSMFVGERRTLLTSLADFWKIRDPPWDYGGSNIFRLAYKLNNMVEDSMASWTDWE